MKLFLIVAFLITVIFLLEKFTNKWLGVKKKKLSETPGKKVDFWVRVSIVALFVCTIPLLVSGDVFIPKWYWIVYLTVLLGSQVILERIYLKNSKQYISTLIGLIIVLLFIYFLEPLLHVLTCISLS
ncbi:DUF4181 domain-containing protein [Peribacillus kribbensis]|uniref:DUF4181 domain-containing protein n=1 Tax=Peribacillus kribbensis TaxID=356658 RepID=UPI00047AF587